MSNPQNIVIVTNIPNPYRIPLFNSISEKIRGKGLNLVVLFADRSYSRRKFDLALEDDLRFDHYYLGSKQANFGNEEKTYFTYSNFTRHIRNLDPACVIVNGFSIAATWMWLMSFSKKIPYIIWCGSVLKKGRFDSPMRRIQRKLLIRRAAGYIAYGSSSREYLVKMGADRSRIFIGLNTVDTVYFRQQTEQFRTKRQDHDNVFRLLTVGYVYKRKNLARLLDLMELLTSRHKNVHLDIIGDGPELAELKDESSEKKLNSFVTFHGFRQKSELPSYFARADSFLFQTDFDIWGLVLNEAMSAGLLCLASGNAGATKDLIEHGVTGFKVDFSDPDSVMNILEPFIMNKESSSEIRANAEQFIAHNATIDHSASGFIEAIRSVSGSE